MTADGFFPADLTIVVCLFDTALDNTLTVLEPISAHLSFDGRGDPSEFPVVMITAVAFNLFYSRSSEIGFHRFIDLIDPVHFILFQRGACVPVFTAASFTFQEIAYELLFHYKIAYQDVIDCYHWDYTGDGFLRN